MNLADYITMLNFESTYLRIQSIILLQWRDTSTLNAIKLFNQQIFNILKSRRLASLIEANSYSY
jgi:hypothetical protein